MATANYNKRTSIGKEEFLDAIPGSKGQLFPIETQLNCTRGALRNLLAKYPELQDELNDELEREKDRIIIAMIEDSLHGEPKERGKARDSLLKAIARDRGFGERLEVTGANGQPLVFLHTAAKILPVNDWAKKAELYAESENAAIEAKISEVLDTPLLPGGEDGGK